MESRTLLTYSSRRSMALFLTILALGFSLGPVPQAEAGFFRRLFFGPKKESVPLPKELGSLRQAYTFADKSLSPVQMDKEIVEELDQNIGEKWWKEKEQKENPVPEIKGQLIKTYFEQLPPPELERLRDEEFKGQKKFSPSLSQERPLRSFEAWKRSNDKTHSLVLQDLTLDSSQLIQGSRMSHFLPEKDVPFGGNFFTDNWGGISRRWKFRDFFKGEFFDYQTFHEKAKGQLDRVTQLNLQRLKKNDRQEYAALVEKCQTEYAELSQVKCYQKINEKWTQDTNKAIVVEKLKKLSQKDLDSLSPTEKYDIANGYFDFRTTEFEKYYKGKRRKKYTKSVPFLSTFLFNLYWEGRCNGDRACGICERHNEPVHQLTVDVAEIGRNIVFEPLDIKALFMSTYFYVENYAMMGKRTVSHETRNRIPPNMAAFDALLRGSFTRNNYPFVIDNNKGPSINNVTVVGYDRMVQSVRPIREAEKNSLLKALQRAKEGKGIDQDPLNIPKNFGDGTDPGNFQNELSLYEKVAGATKVVKIKTRLTVLKELPMAKANRPTKKVIAEQRKFTKKEDIEYELFLDDNNRIVEGKYLSGNIDFIWFADGRGTEELQEDGNKLIKYDVMKDMAVKSSQQPQAIDRRIFPGQQESAAD